MAHNEIWTPTATVAKRVREVRSRRGWTADELAKAMTEQGVKWERSTVAKLENGSRQNISLTEWLTLAAVLNVGPMHLLLPIGDSDDQYQVTPERTDRVEHARGWVRGYWPLPGANIIQYQGEMPEEEQGRIHLPPAKERADRINGIEASIAQLSTALQHLREEDDGKH
ncbi:helix-turn-helix domain-containing protein [Streptomyces sp. WAC01280]|jgi:transcriptional regulator with XRE-family HTH domain|uniref:helix-turn-helix domain-containing protein n=1 Tax=Streptomyces sp. WAC01280 TaxID=2487424 RepID=UPI000F7B8C46|nr:helix-turn-helix transcriptional regulator [Streptomyces sp. WAC01280]RSS52161.1 XRE family transcriptional regulator [Streptomyces sp. WAC01280]